MLDTIAFCINQESGYSHLCWVQDARHLGEITIDTGIEMSADTRKLGLERRLTTRLHMNCIINHFEDADIMQYCFMAVFPLLSDARVKCCLDCLRGFARHSYLIYRFAQSLL